MSGPKPSLRRRIANVLAGLARRLEPDPARRELLAQYQSAPSPAPGDKPALRAAMAFWFDALAAADRRINALCFDYYEGRHPKHFLWSAHTQCLLDEIRPGQRVLDVGCSNSAYPARMAEAGARVVAMDLSAQRIDEARRANAHPNLEYVLGDATKELPEGRFDVAVCSHVIEHLDDPELLLRPLTARVDKLVVKVPLVDSGWMKLVKKDLGLPWLDDADHRREYTEELLARHLEQSGWRVVSMVRGLDLRAVAVPAGPIAGQGAGTDDGPHENRGGACAE